MSIFWKWNWMKRRLALLVILFLFTSVLAQPATAKNGTADHKKRTIVLDPGHGGHDQGAKGPEGTLEKNVTLNLAMLIAKELETTYQVILTRTDDYWIDFYDRTAIANHADADLFISLHTGGSFLHQTTGTFVYFYKKPAGQVLSFDDDQIRPSDDSNVQAHWTYIQSRHETASRLLAKLMQQHLNQQTQWEKSEIKGASLTVLEGADMPAVLIEIGYLTNPTEEKSLNDINVLTHIAKGIRGGVDEFFKPAHNSSSPE